MDLLKVVDLTVQFQNMESGQEAVKGISFEVFPGEIVGIAGESGSGKSTAMHAILGLLPKSAGVSFETLMLQGEGITPSLLKQGKIAMVFQDPLTYLNPSLKIGLQVEETVRAHRKCTRKEAREEAEELLLLVGIREPLKRMGQYPFQLSGGMRQRVVLAIALACRPKLLIADEPTTALDATVQGQILRLLKRIAKETEVSILLVSHDLSVLSALSSRILIMQHGKIVEEGTAEDIFYHPCHPYTKQLVAWACDRKKRSENPAREEVILKAEHISKEFKSVRTLKSQAVTEAVRDVSFQIHKGETYGLVGESGCGKTTLAGLVTGMLSPTQGQVVKEKGMIKEYGIQMIFQDSYASLNPRMTVEEILEEPLLLASDDTVEQRRKKMEKILEVTGLGKEALKKYPKAFSGGERQRIGIARALLLNPELIVCDEPVSALDVSTQGQILGLLEDIQKKSGISYLFISHDLSVVKRLSARIGVMYGGSLVETGITEDLYTDPWHPYTKALLASIPVPDPRKARRKLNHLYTEEKREVFLGGQGCPYASRCGYALKCCKEKMPKPYCYGNRTVACFLYSGEHAGKRDKNYQMTSQI